MKNDLREKYINKSIAFHDLPDDLQTVIIQRIILGCILGIFILAFGICSKSLSFLGISILSLLTDAFLCALPYYLATRNRLIQIAGICMKKDTLHFFNHKTYYLFLSSNSNHIRVNVKRIFYRASSENMEIHVYVLPESIRQDSNGTYLIETPLFVTSKTQLQIMEQENT